MQTKHGIDSAIKTNPDSNVNIFHNRPKMNGRWSLLGYRDPIEVSHGQEGHAQGERIVSTMRGLER